MWRYSASIVFTFISLCLSGLSYGEVASDRLHQPFDQMLKAYVLDGHVNYPGFQQDARFPQYLEFLANTNPDQLETKEEQLAFWINAYNALTIKGILDGKSPSSLFGRYKFFISTKYPLAGKSVSLDTLEKKIIIPYEEPAIHFAIVCASLSCPKLISEAYTAENLEQQLTNNAKAFLRNAEKNQLDISKKKIKVSKIFKWFSEDFAVSSGSVQKYIAQFIDDQDLKNKLSNESFKIKHLKYNWNLNGTPPN